MTKHKFEYVTKFEQTGHKREQCSVCGTLRWTLDNNEVKQWQPKHYYYHIRDCDAPEPEGGEL